MKNETQTVIADHRSCSDRVHNLLQLRQAGFSHDQIRALSAVMGDVAWEAMLPSMERVDRRFGAMKLHMDGLEQRADRRSGMMKLHMDGREQRMGELERRTGRLERRTDDALRQCADNEMRRRVDDGLRQCADDEMRRRVDDGLRRYPGEAESSFVMPESRGALMQPQVWAFVAMMILGLTGIVAALLAARIIG